MKLVLTNGTVIDGTGRAPIVGATVVVDGDRISAITERRPPDVKTSEDVEIIDCRDKFVLPGLIDSHVHLAFCAGPDHPATIRQLLDDSEEMLALRELRHAQECLMAGITTVRDCGSRGFGPLAVRDAIASGLHLGPRIQASGPPVTITFGHLYFCGLEVEGVDRIRIAIRKLAKRGVDLIKVMVTGGVMTGNAKPMICQYSQAELNVLCEEAHRLDKKVAGHVSSAEGIKRSVEAGMDTIEHCNWVQPGGTTGYDPKVVEKMIAQGTVVGRTVSGIRRLNLIPNPITTDVERQRALEKIYESWQPLRDMRAAGVKMMVSSDSGVRITPFGNIYLSLMMYSSVLGVTPLETLTAVTQAPAEAMGLADDLGTIAVGKIADLLILDADPLVDLMNVRHVHLVIKGGEPVVSNGELIIRHPTELVVKERS